MSGRHSTDDVMNAALAEDAAYIEAMGQDPGMTLDDLEECAEHDFQGCRVFADGRGSEQVCTRCGLGAMAWTMRFLP